ncbi:hypothetical protein PTSG_01329 [Salpingoeca rosetta]|uniref:Uncharacterized protein n=1 Tax=Salpingoeca rosetta (strain ATCC 50818 / BSB-021) TaxID=946362 RepID=F2U011_SALR5|nr:uncharacterized protein PTSG_01329 [Salpingoeca rosetta]EGD80739.1 hypothetical protein PTSG_01329 [Salpingoeca rosetta]|eukprot:XP_004997300.1 hypothetical protein PTSG_01329 [Salpingoeca rosetta]
MSFVLPEPFRTIDGLVKRMFEAAWKEILIREELQAIKGDNFIHAQEGWEQQQLPADAQVCFGRIWTRSESVLGPEHNKQPKKKPNAAVAFPAPAPHVSGRSAGALLIGAPIKHGSGDTDGSGRLDWQVVMELPPRARGLPCFALLPLRQRRRVQPHQGRDADQHMHPSTSAEDGEDAQQPTGADLVLFVYHPTTHVYMCLQAPPPPPPTAKQTQQAQHHNMKSIIVDQGVLPVPHGGGSITDVVPLLSRAEHAHLFPRPQPAQLSSGTPASTAATTPLPQAQSAASTSTTAMGGSSSSSTYIADDDNDASRVLTHVAVSCDGHFVLFDACSWLSASRAKGKGRPKSRATPALQLLHLIGSIATKQKAFSAIQDDHNQQVFLAELGRARLSVVSLTAKASSTAALKDRPILLSGSVTSVGHIDGVLLFGLSNGNVSVFTLAASMKGVADRCVLIECPPPPEGREWEDMSWEDGELLLSCTDNGLTHVCSLVAGTVP